MRVTVACKSAGPQFPHSVGAELVTTRISVMLVCDLNDGQQAAGAQMIRSGPGRQDYEIDAGPDCARRLRGTLRPFITRCAAARPAATSQRASPSHRARRSDLDADAVIHAYRDERAITEPARGPVRDIPARHRAAAGQARDRAAAPRPEPGPPARRLPRLRRREDTVNSPSPTRRRLAGTAMRRHRENQ
jgi:hypothetical protein